MEEERVVINRRAKGMANERKAVKELEKDSWLVYRVKGSTRFNKEVDIFGLWDILAIKRKKYSLDRYPYTILKLIQVRTNQRRNIDEHKAFAYKYPDILCEIWVYRDRKEKKVYCL